MAEQSLVPVDQREVLFYDDRITAVLVNDGKRQEIYVPIRPLCDLIELSWSGQYERIQRDPVLATALKGVRIIRTPEAGGAQEMVCLPLKYLPGWLFGVQTTRIRNPVLQEKIIRYQRESYDVLWEAFQQGRLTGDVDFEALLAQDTPDLGSA